MATIALVQTAAVPAWVTDTLVKSAMTSGVM